MGCTIYSSPTDPVREIGQSPVTLSKKLRKEKHLEEDEPGGIVSGNLAVSAAKIKRERKRGREKQPISLSCYEMNT